MIGKDSIYFSIKPYQLNKVAFIQAAIIHYHPYDHARLSLVQSKNILSNDSITFWLVSMLMRATFCDEVFNRARNSVIFTIALVVVLIFGMCACLSTHLVAMNLKTNHFVNSF